MNIKIMKLKTLVLAIAAFAMVAVSSKAQTTASEKISSYPYVFVGVQGGVQTTFTNYDQAKLITPIGGLQVGAHFTPVVGARLHVSGINNKGGINGLGEYKYKYVTSDIDVMLNLANIFCPSKGYHRFNPYLVGGVGLAYSWDNEALNVNPLLPLAWEDNRLVHNFRAGLMLEYDVCHWLGVNLEVDANNYHDRYNSKVNGRGDWQLTGMIGLNFKFGRCKAKAEPVVPPVYVPAPEPAPVVVPEPEPEPVVVSEPEPAPVVAPEPEPVKVEPVKEPETTTLQVNFGLNQTAVPVSEESKVAEFAQWLKSHPGTKASITGYADAGTGNAEINARLARERVNSVRKLLVNKYGVQKARLTEDSKGDTVQPLPSNDDNRVVLGVAK